MSTEFQVATIMPAVARPGAVPLALRGVPPEIRMVVALTGEMDLASRDIAYNACVRDTHRDVVVDLTEVSFLDCAGYGALMSARRILEQRGGSLVLRNQTDQPARLLSLIHIGASE